MTSLIIAAALKGIVVLGAAWIATSLLRRNSADLRHRVWLAAFVAIELRLVSDNDAIIRGIEFDDVQRFR